MYCIKISPIEGEAGEMSPTPTSQNKNSNNLYYGKNYALNVITID